MNALLMFIVFVPFASTVAEEVEEFTIVPLSLYKAIMTNTGWEDAVLFLRVTVAPTGWFAASAVALFVEPTLNTALRLSSLGTGELTVRLPVLTDS